MESKMLKRIGRDTYPFLLTGKLEIKIQLC